MACAPSEDSDQFGHPPSLIRVFAVRMKKAWVLSYPLSAQRRLRWAQSHFVGFVMRRIVFEIVWSLFIKESFRIFLQIYVAMGLVFLMTGYKKLRDMCNTHVWCYKPCESPNFDFRYKYIRRSDPAPKHLLMKHFKIVLTSMIVSWN